MLHQYLPTGYLQHSFRTRLLRRRASLKTRKTRTLRQSGGNFCRSHRDSPNIFYLVLFSLPAIALHSSPSSIFSLICRLFHLPPALRRLPSYIGRRSSPSAAIQASHSALASHLFVFLRCGPPVLHRCPNLLHLIPGCSLPKPQV